VLRWDGEGRRLWTDAPVELVRQGSVVRGTGFELRTADETVTLARVRAIFQPAAPR
jgi:lipopolysaccharide export system protein LptC